MLLIAPFWPCRPGVFSSAFHGEGEILFLSVSLSPLQFPALPLVHLVRMRLATCRLAG